MFGPLLFDFSIEVDPDWSAERRARHLAKREWRVRLGRWLRDSALPLLDGPATLVIDSVVPQIGLPTVRAALVWTESATLMELPQEALDAELATLTRS